MMFPRLTAAVLTMGATLVLVPQPTTQASLIPEQVEALPANAAVSTTAAPEMTPTPAPAAQTMSADCCTPAPVCCRQPCITYRQCGPKLCCGPCQPPVETVLKVKNPCTGCESDVTVCRPACCTGEPKICFTTGFLGRNVVEYEWCCGYSVRVAFKHTGDLLVTTWGR